MCPSRSQASGLFSRLGCGVSDAAMRFCKRVGLIRRRVEALLECPTVTGQAELARPVPGLGVPAVHVPVRERLRPEVVRLLGIRVYDGLVLLWGLRALYGVLRNTGWKHLGARNPNEGSKKCRG